MLSKQVKAIAYTILISLVFVNCSDDFLDHTPRGAISSDLLEHPDRVEDLIIAAYAAMGNDEFNMPFASMWMWGSVRSDDAYKGGGGTGDGAEIDQYEQFFASNPRGWRNDNTWTRIYAGVARSNSAIRVLKDIDKEDFPLRDRRIAEMRFIRGHFHFILRTMYKYVPYIHDEIPTEDYPKVSNRALSNNEFWDVIAEEFQFAAEHLPPTQNDVGRPNEFTAKAYLAKVRLFQAYEQDDQHNVVNVNTDRMQEVIDLTDEVLASGKWDLHEDFAMNFIWEYDNGVESVFTIQNSYDDGTDDQRLDTGNGLNYHMAPEYGCCGFHQPAQNLVNAFKTDENGLPKFDTYNDTEMNEPEDFQINYSVDPRLDHTIGVPSHPFKYDPDFEYQEGYARTPDTYGYYSTMKETQHPDSPNLRQYGPFIGSSKNQDVIRFAEILLWRAEALIEVGRHQDALPLINQLRERAKNSTDRLKYDNGEYFSNYRIENYQPGDNINWNQETARTALRWETRLELAMEGRRFFDLVRWGIAAETLNKFFAVETSRRPYLNRAEFTKNQHEYLPIPQAQIDFADVNVYVQNPGYN